MLAIELRRAVLSFQAATVRGVGRVVSEAWALHRFKRQTTPRIHNRIQIQARESTWDLSGVRVTHWAMYCQHNKLFRYLIPAADLRDRLEPPDQGVPQLSPCSPQWFLGVPTHRLGIKLGSDGRDRWLPVCRTSPSLPLHMINKEALLAASLCAAVSLALIRKWQKNRSRPPYPPGPKGYPLIGNVLDVPQDIPAWKTFITLAQNSGKCPLYFH